MSLDHFVDVVQRDAEPFQDVDALLALVQVELGAPDDHLAAVLQEVAQDLLQVEQHGPLAHNGHHVDAEARLKGRELVQGVDDNVRDGPALEVHDDADALAVRLVAQVRDALDALLVHQGRDLFPPGWTC